MVIRKYNKNNKIKNKNKRIVNHLKKKTKIVKENIQTSSQIKIFYSSVDRKTGKNELRKDICSEALAGVAH